MLRSQHVEKSAAYETSGFGVRVRGVDSVDGTSRVAGFGYRFDRGQHGQTQPSTIHVAVAIWAKDVWTVVDASVRAGTVTLPCPSASTSPRYAASLCAGRTCPHLKRHRRVAQCMMPGASRQQS